MYPLCGSSLTLLIYTCHLEENGEAHVLYGWCPWTQITKSGFKCLFSNEHPLKICLQPHESPSSGTRALRLC